ncbi:cytochrome P450 2J6-like [Clavelina lepadiformis]|uniref:cytochrome P450 2J6-like n=1 Tax=Clavelina lepadiformis TaxID=159417 RepID=UPI0040425591
MFELDLTNLINVYFLLCLSGLLLLYWYQRPRNFPPGPRGIPIFGMLPFMGKYGERKLAKWSKTYGPVMSLRMGRNDVVFLNDFNSIHEALVKQHAKFSGRTDAITPFMKDIMKNVGYIVLDDGEFFKSQKKLGQRVLSGLGVGGRKLESRVTEEASYLNEAIRSMDGKAFDASIFIKKAVANNICNIIFGERFDYDNKQIEEILSRLTAFTADTTTALASRICVLAPFLRDIPPIIFVYSRYKERLSMVFEFIKKKVDEHKETFNEDYLRDFIDAFLKESIKDNNNWFTNDQLIFYIRELFFAGTETVSSTLTWALLCLLHYPEVHQKLRREILNVIGYDGTASMTHKPMMPYTRAFLQEVMRYRTLAPLSIFHKTNEDAELNGYFIPKNTMVGPNIWAVHNDPDFWDEPEKFKPERFIDDKGEFVQPSHIIPFSLGPRACLGKQLAKMEIFIFLVSMVQRFEFLPNPDDYELPEVEHGTSGVAFVPHPFRLVAKIC